MDDDTRGEPLAAVLSGERPFARSWLGGMEKRMAISFEGSPASGHAMPAAAPTARSPWIDIDPKRFDPWRIQRLTHRLQAHPLLQLDQLVELGRRLETRGSVRTHSSTAKPGTPFNSAPELFPNTRSAGETLASIRDAKAWMSLLNIQIDPVYRELVEDVLDSVRPQVETRDPGMCHRAGWIFVTSPNTVTPYHFDKEHNFIMQVQGRKRLYVWDHRDTVAASEQARDLFHHSHERYLLQWSEAFRERAHVFDLEPGQGAYMPSTSPHLVENGEEPSVTASFTYYTDATRRDALLHKSHALMRKFGLTPAAVGRRPAVDATIHAIASMLRRNRVQPEFARSDAG